MQCVCVKNPGGTHHCFHGFGELACCCFCGKLRYQTLRPQHGPYV
jgi:hypothetical protein